MSDHVAIWKFILTLTRHSNEILYTLMDKAKRELKRAAGVNRGKRTLISQSRYSSAFAFDWLRKTWLHEGFKGQYTTNKTSFCNSPFSQRP